MAIHVALNHITHYSYDRLVNLAPHVVRLRPAPHSRTKILSYSQRVEPALHFVNWQQDPFANYQARLVFPEPMREFKVTIDLVVEMAVHNPFDFFLEPFAEAVPFAYPSALKAELAQLKDLNRQMTEEAHELATALKGQAKKQGNWGELVLENVLARSGLQLGKDYRREVSFNTEEGKQRPDVVIYLPEAKHLIVDAKVSLNAYTRYVNAEDELERKQALKEHVKAVADRITELADRRYFDLGDLNSPEMVFMFVPIESAFVEALRADENLFQQALERNVLVATPTTLLTSLNIVRQLWRLENQNAHSAALADSASKLYNKFTVFLSTMEELGRKLDAARLSYGKAFGQLYEGPGNLIKRAKEFEQLGVAVKGALPQYLVEKAELEIELLPPSAGPEAGDDEPSAEDRAA